MRAVNLLPRDAAQPTSFAGRHPEAVVGSVLGAVVLVALVAGFLNVHSKVSSERRSLAAARAELVRAQAERQAREAKLRGTPIVPVPAVTSEEQPRLAAVADALGSRIAWDRILREFSLVLPDDVKITSLSMAAPSPTAAAGAPAGSGGEQGFSISGSTFSHDGVARFLSRLTLIPDLTNVTLGSSTAGTDGGAGVQFTITASVKGSVAPAPPTPTTGAPS